MRTATEVLQEIKELENIKSSLNHFLCSYDASILTSCTEVAVVNKTIISSNLKALYNEFATINEVKPEYKEATTIRTKYVASPNEEIAIANFYSNKKYTLTE